MVVLKGNGDGGVRVMVKEELCEKVVEVRASESDDSCFLRTTC